VNGSKLIEGSLKNASRSLKESTLRKAGSNGIAMVPRSVRLMRMRNRRWQMYAETGKLK
jgi:hypothetical protein